MRLIVPCPACLYGHSRRFAALFWRHVGGSCSSAFLSATTPQGYGIRVFSFLCHGLIIRKRCGFLVPISLPHPIPEEIQPSQGESAPTENAHPRLLVACPSCAVVYACLEQDLDHFPVQMPALRLARLHPSLIRAQCNCGTEKCGTRVEIHTVMASGTKLSELRRIASTWNFQKLSCLGCHASLQECLSRDYQFHGFEPPIDLN